MSKTRGLPTDIKMRHDEHYVEELIKSYSSKYEFRELPVEKIILSDEQPRKDIGDLEGLMTSIKEKGVLEPILVRKEGNLYSLISGERRYRASMEIGLLSIPAIILNASDLETLEIALIENIQRKDLTPFEESYGYSMLIERFNLTHEEIARRIGKSRINITETLILRRIPQNIRKICEEKSMISKSMLIEIARLDDEKEMISLINEIALKGLTREDIRKIRKQRKDSDKKVKPYRFTYKPENKEFTLNLIFKKQNVEKHELINALEKILERLKSET